MATPNSFSLDWSLSTVSLPCLVMAGHAFSQVASAWQSTPVLRGVTLDLFDSRSTSQVFSSSQPKAIAFYAGEGEAKRDEIDLVSWGAVEVF